MMGGDELHRPPVVALRFLILPLLLLLLITSFQRISLTSSDFCQYGQVYALVFLLEKGVDTLLGVIRKQGECPFRHQGARA